MTSNKRAVCPLCDRTTATFTHNGRRIYVQHYMTNRGRAHILGDGVCEASGWLVEDDELVVIPQTPRRTSGIAQPSKSSWHCVNGTCARGRPCTDLCRTIPDAPPARPKTCTQETER